MKLMERGKMYSHPGFWAGKGCSAENAWCFETRDYYRIWFDRDRFR